MKEIRYKSFSLKRHHKSLRQDKASVCQFELTYGCHFHCKHCYTDCYNKPVHLEKELTTVEIKSLLDKMQQAGIIWLCLTGGDPLTRPDFLNIYSYAKKKGFMITVFTNGYSLTRKMIGCFKKMPPFVIEITLNSITERSYESISRLKGSFAKVMEAIQLLLKEKIPLKIKTQITRDNLAQLPQIKKFVNGLGVEFSFSPVLYPRLNGDLKPCRLRITPREVLNLYEFEKNIRPKVKNKISNCACPLFSCAIESGDGINIDPYGHIFLCGLIRDPKIDLLKADVDDARRELLSWARNRAFTSDSKCKACESKPFCAWCPGKAYAEKGSLEEPIEYYCESAGRR